MTAAIGKVAALFRHPVKGFTPEPVDAVTLEAGQTFPNDRLFAIENGPSGYDPNQPRHISKQKFTVLARQASVANLSTRYDDASGVFHVTFPEGQMKGYDLGLEDGRVQLACDLSHYFGDAFEGPLKVVEGAQTHRFTDHPKGQVSLLNLASLDAVNEAMSYPVSVARFRMNVYVEGLAAWEEDQWQPGDRIRLGEAELVFLTHTVRCKATHANPETGEYDRDLVSDLFRHFERNTFGIYAQVVKGGRVQSGDDVEVQRVL
ncbi:MAG: MOSC domain-containing protein [Ponticaulis sp.]|nr:MOSC domain-containing protein [Ponticaulis sp.]|tara:strand:+ start:2430 stop:3212 length:783 start_codon:yes stop_codon:yes gene_type:complete